MLSYSFFGVQKHNQIYKVSEDENSSEVQDFAYSRELDLKSSYCLHFKGAVILFVLQLSFIESEN